MKSYTHFCKVQVQLVCSGFMVIVGSLTGTRAPFSFQPTGRREGRWCYLPFPIQTGTDQFTPHSKCLIQKPSHSWRRPVNIVSLCGENVLSCRVWGCSGRREWSVYVCVLGGYDNPLQFVSTVLMTLKSVTLGITVMPSRKDFGMFLAC